MITYVPKVIHVCGKDTFVHTHHALGLQQFNLCDLFMLQNFGSEKPLYLAFFSGCAETFSLVVSTCSTHAHA
jgi:hypothetical protein